MPLTTAKTMNSSESSSRDKLLLASAEGTATVETDRRAARPLQAGQAFSACPFDGLVQPAMPTALNSGVRGRAPGLILLSLPASQELGWYEIVEAAMRSLGIVFAPPRYASTIA